MAESVFRRKKKWSPVRNGLVLVMTPMYTFGISDNFYISKQFYISKLNDRYLWGFGQNFKATQFRHFSKPYATDMYSVVCLHRKSLK